MAAFQAILTNEKTGETVLLKSNDRYTLQNKIDKKEEVWAKKNAQLEKIEEKEESIRRAEKNTAQAIAEIDSFRKILHSTLSVNDIIDWSTLEDHKPFKAYEPVSKPDWDEFSKTVPQKSIFEFVPHFKQKRLLAEKDAKHNLEKALKEWELEEEKRKKIYEKEKSGYLKNQENKNLALAKTKSLHESGDPKGVEKYFELVLEKSKYPDTLDMYSQVQYGSEGKILLVSVDLPTITQVPKIKEYKYISARKETVVSDLGKKEFEELYNDVIYQITLRTVHEVLESDYAKQVDMVVFNGWVNGIDARTGKDFKNCIVSLQVLREQFLEINLEKISPQECFRHLKGISAGSLVNLAPVKPIMSLKQEDDRIISADEVLSTLDASQNLATMDWQQFEVLVRDLISKEFSHEGCKVEVTRASRDAGVDAIAFDQDPIRGGKYVIQAKRYNNLVPVSAVRDLFGTVMNEGAVKGILITTSYYGPDALAFANNKPITLINGEQLLYMFNKHGYDFQIQLAKKQKAASTISY